jgi:hypothetical protein
MDVLVHTVKSFFGINDLQIIATIHSSSCKHNWAWHAEWNQRRVYAAIRSAVNTRWRMLQGQKFCVEAGNVRGPKMERVGYPKAVVFKKPFLKCEDAF